jgi:hypothetical protein
MSNLFYSLNFIMILRKDLSSDLPTTSFKFKDEIYWQAQGLQGGDIYTSRRESPLDARCNTDTNWVDVHFMRESSGVHERECCSQKSGEDWQTDRIGQDR